jgi:cell division protein FtsI/penicillin-binding protein 2
MKDNFLILKQKIKRIKIKNMRIKIIKVFHLFLVATLFTRIAFIHHVYADHYVASIEKKEEKFVYRGSSTRGNIYDRDYHQLVVNVPVTSIIYRFNPEIGISKMLEDADLLAELIEVDTDKLTARDLEDIYRRENNLTDDVELTRNQRESVSEQLKQAYVIFKKMSEAYYGGENTLKFSADDMEIACVSEKINLLSGVDIISSTIREYPSVLGQHDLLGHLSKEGGLPFENFQQYIAAGYSINDRIGLSCIEQQYEDWLRGHKSVYASDLNGNIETLFDGLSGTDLTLTINARFTSQIDDILEKRMRSSKYHRPGAKYLNEGYVVVVNPNSGEILSLNGMILNDDGTVINHPLGTLYNTFTMGSVVKGATLLTGYAKNVVEYGDVIHDKPMIFSDGSQKGSWSNLGMINDIDALRFSSNVYFMEQAIRMGGDVYYPRNNLNIDLSSINEYRMSFEQFGLGTSTGIDLPGEQTGLRTPDKSIAKLLDLVIGQSDTYTTVQLAQYVSTVANGGNRYALQLLKEATIPLDEDHSILVYSFEPKLLNTVDLPDVAFERVHEGFRQALQVYGGTGNQVFNHSTYNPAGKTGTAEEFARDHEGKLIYTDSGHLIPVHHMTFVGYAPADNPEIAVAVVFPQSELPKQQNPLVLEVADDVFKAYFELHK